MLLLLSLEPTGRVSKLLKSFDDSNGKDTEIRDDDDTERKEEI